MTFASILSKNTELMSRSLIRRGLSWGIAKNKLTKAGTHFASISIQGSRFTFPETEIEITVPFTGDAAVFTIQDRAYPLNPLPHGSVEDDTLIFLISGVDLEHDEVSKQINRTLDHVDRCLTRIRGDADRLNSELDSIARDCIEQRRARLLANQNLVASLGFKLKQRDDSAKTYQAPEVRRKITPTPPQASSMPYKPEPTLVEADYEHILGVIENMTQVMERSPSAFSKMDEESLRWFFLVPLNGHYEGEATGETFNYGGKTDILIRSKGKNIFIAECKFWDGPKKLTETINHFWAIILGAIRKWP